MKIDNRVWPNKKPDILQFLGIRIKIPKNQWFEVMRIFTEKLLEINPELLTKIAKEEKIRGTDRIWLSTKKESLQNPHKINNNLYFYGYTGAYDVGRYVDKLLREFKIDERQFRIICTDGSILPPEDAYESSTFQNYTTPKYEDILKSEEELQRKIRDNPDSVIKAKAKLAKKTVERYETTVTYYYRDPWVIENAKIKANGFCQLCNERAPFLTSDGKPYLETHHIIWLSNHGEDTIENTVALCPNCHKKMHILNNEADVEKLKEIAKK